MTIRSDEATTSGTTATAGVCQPQAESSGALQHDDRVRRAEDAIGLLRAWREGDDGEEQKETWEVLKRSLDEDRPSYRKLFP